MRELVWLRINHLSKADFNEGSLKSSTIKS